MSKKKIRELRDLVIDEISLVDKGANQHATVTIAKRHGEEEEMSQYYDDGGSVVDIDSLSHGDVVYDEEGDAYQFEEDGAYEYEQEPELAGVSKAFQRSYPQSSLAENFRVELSKALTDDDRDEVIAKAFSQIDEIQKSADEARYAAETERQMRLEREYIEVAKNYEVGVHPEDLGPVLMRMAETMDEQDCLVIAKALDSATAVADTYLDEIGNRGGGSNSDVFDQVEALLDQEVAKGDLGREEAVTGFFETNPQAYDDYLAERQGR